MPAACEPTLSRAAARRRPRNFLLRLFYNLQVLRPAQRLVVGRRRRRLQRRGRRVERGGRISRHRERESISGFLGEDPRYRASRNRDLLRRAAEARGELHPIVVDREPPGGTRADVEEDLAVLDVRGRNARLRVDLDREIWRQAVVRAPFADGADEVGLGGLLGHGIRIRQPPGHAREPGADPAISDQDYLRIPRSAEVSASMNAGREKSRSAYFISGAAGFGSWMP